MKLVTPRIVDSAQPIEQRLSLLKFAFEAVTLVAWESSENYREKYLWTVF